MCRRAPTHASSWMDLPGDFGGMPSALQTRNMGTAQSCDAPNDFAAPMIFDVPFSPSPRLAAPSDSQPGAGHVQVSASPAGGRRIGTAVLCALDRKSTRLNSSHSQISYAVFCLKKKKQTRYDV